MVTEGPEDVVGGRVLRVLTSNEGKAREFAAALEGVPWRVERVAGAYEEVQADTLDEVAMASALAVLRDRLAEPVFVLEDAGLFVEALSGFPGVYSAYVFRTLGVDGVLRLMEGGQDRRARFESRIALCLPGGAIEVLAGTCRGVIPAGARGAGGFGFDPIFVPEGDARTFAEMTLEEKGAVSHRGRALSALRGRLAGL
jgi:XTP/dITP diphosphohydrolase